MSSHGLAQSQEELQACATRGTTWKRVGVGEGQWHQKYSGKKKVEEGRGRRREARTHAYLLT
jgi:hypothetical protein